MSNNKLKTIFERLIADIDNDIDSDIDIDITNDRDRKLKATINDIQKKIRKIRKKIEEESESESKKNVLCVVLEIFKLWVYYLKLLMALKNYYIIDGSKKLLH